VVTDAELLCLAVAQVLLRYNDEGSWPRPSTLYRETTSKVDFAWQ